MENKTASTQLKELIETYFNLDELRELCFELNIEYENLVNPQGTRKGASIALLKMAYQHGKQDKLVELCRQKRPHLDWPSAPTKLYFEEDIQAEAKRQEALNEYKKYICGKWGRDSLLGGPLANFYIPLEGQGPEEKKLKEASSPPETRKDSLPESSSDDSEASRQTQDKKEPQYISYRPLPLDLQEALEKHQRLIVSGTAGTGKSTFLRHLVHQKTTNNDTTVPIWVSLADFAKVIENPQPGPQTKLKEWAIEMAHEDPTIQAILNRAVEDNQVLWLLDGFDETGNQMNKVADAIAQLPSKNQLVLSTRPDTRLENHLLRFNATQYEMRDLRQNDVEKFLQKWFFDETDKATEVLEWLAADPHRWRLATKPLHLVLLATITEKTSQEDFPETPTQLYAKFIDIFLDKRIEKKSNSRGIDFTDFFELGNLNGNTARAAALKGFYYFGWVLFHQEMNLINSPLTTKEQVVACLQRAGGDLEQNAEEIFSFWQEAGIQQSFHLSFWPYAAAYKLYNDWQKDAENTWRFLSSATRNLPYASRLHHSAWQEPILMLAALMNEGQLNELIGCLLRKRGKEERYLHQNLRLAAAIIGEIEAGKLNKGREQKIIGQLGKLTRNYSRWHSPMLLVGFFIVSLIGLLVSGLLAFYGYLPLLFFGILIFLWVLFWLPFTLRVRLPGLFRIPTRVLWRIITGADLAITHILRSLGLESAYPHIFVTTLSSAGETAIPELERTFELRDWIEKELSHEVVRAMGNTGSKEAVFFLSDIMNEAYDDIRLVAADSLRRIDHESATEALIRGIEKNDYIALRGSYSWFPLPSSPFIISSTAVLPLTNALKNSRESGVRWLAAITLGEIGDKRAIPFLISALDDNSGFVGELAAKALIQIGPDTVPYLHTALDSESVSDDTRYKISPILVELGDLHTIDHLVPYLKDSDGDVVRNTIRNVLVQAGKVKGEKAIDQYLQICKLNPYDEATRTTFLDVLNELGLTYAILDLIDIAVYGGVPR